MTSDTRLRPKQQDRRSNLPQEAAQVLTSHFVRAGDTRDARGDLELCHSARRKAAAEQCTADKVSRIEIGRPLLFRPSTLAAGLVGAPVDHGIDGDRNVISRTIGDPHHELTSTVQTAFSGRAAFAVVAYCARAGGQNLSVNHMQGWRAEHDALRFMGRHHQR